MFRKYLALILQILASLPLLVIFIGVIWQVFSRYVLSIPSQNSEELIRFAQVFVTFLAGAYCFTLNKHIALDLFELRNTWSLLTKILISFRLVIISFLSVVVLLYGGVLKSVNQFSQLSSSFNISMAYIYAVIPLSGVIISCWVIVALFKIWRS